ncbi:hypothetical protein GCM10025771_07140 [Niveibacterium umoris]|uniref:Phosphate ABC transporter substrate-binding protein n=1 Tax=Niveibacterium umoris TaxID=1193620 RepID=A0A840BL61_9RHOO|nr:hypothetical protein [Niveibacterium umoris]MBB4013740.1 hypothetical protein [Niveibacterium umoris]
MRPIRAFLMSICASIALATGVAAAEEPGDLVVVAGRASTLSTLTREEVTRLYLGERLDGDKSQLKALELDLPPWARGAFYSRLLGRSEVQMRALWARLVFSGKGRPPRIVANADEALRELESSASVIVFLPADKAAAAKLKPLFTL